MMVTTSETITPPVQGAARPSRIAATATLVGWLLLAALVGSFYVGHSPGPYGVCQGRLGRPVPCELVRR